jgi:hypothetical protein
LEILQKLFLGPSPIPMLIFDWAPSGAWFIRHLSSGVYSFCERPWADHHQTFWPCQCSIEGMTSDTATLDHLSIRTMEVSAILKNQKSAYHPKVAHMGSIWMSQLIVGSSQHRIFLYLGVKMPKGTLYVRPCQLKHNSTCIR